VDDTIFALSSGMPPAAIAIVRISGPCAGIALGQLAGVLPAPRVATYRALRGADGALLDQALVLWFPGPGTATGEDLVELHLHGGRAVIAAVEAALDAMSGLRRAEPGEFTRRAFINGRIDLAEAEGLADLLSAETELQRLQALSLASGALSAQVSAWRDEVLAASASVEALLDFGDEDDVEHLPPQFAARVGGLADALGEMLEAPRAEMLREGFRVVLAGPPNSGKSSLFNRLVEEEAAIATPIAGTTRDVMTRPVALAGIPFLFADTAGLREHTDDSIEAIGIERARGELERADLVLWLGLEGQGTGRVVWEIESFADRCERPDKLSARHRLSAVSGEGIRALRDDLVALARKSLPLPGSAALNRRQHDLLSTARAALVDAAQHCNPLLIAEALRWARGAFDRLLGSAATEDMLDALFGRFCIGK
jgi:tRNA modification GTPase